MNIFYDGEYTIDCYILLIINEKKQTMCAASYERPQVFLSAGDSSLPRETADSTRCNLTAL
jgi:hypothetical protein